MTLRREVVTKADRKAQPPKVRPVRHSSIGEAVATLLIYAGMITFATATVAAVFYLSIRGVH